MSNYSFHICYFSQIIVGAIAYTETDNAAGGKTVTIGTVKGTI